MKFKKICYSTQLSDLYGRDKYQSHIEVGREYWYYVLPGQDAKMGWYKIKITYIRSGCAFYVFVDYPNIPEDFFPINCFMASTLVFADIDPSKDLENFGTDLEKQIYCFDDERTIVQNWSNEKEFEIKEDDKLFLIISMLCKKID